MRLSLVVAVAVAACAGAPPPPPPQRTVATARRTPAAVSHGAHATDPPRVDSLRACPPETFGVLARFRSAQRTLHFGPLCTEVVLGHFAAVFATGTPTEATDLWVLVHGDRDEVHRVQRFPVGARIAYGRIVQGWVYLLGRSNALEDMPADCNLLAILPLPHPLGPSPEVRLLSPLEVNLLRSTDEADLARRLTFAVPERDPTVREANALVTEISRGGPNVLLDHLSPEGAPTLRAWQVGMFQETDYVSPQGDPTSVRVSRATALVRDIAQNMDCSAGDRCVGHADALAASASAEVLVRMDGPRAIIAGLLSAAPVHTDLTDGTHPWGPERPATDDEVSLARALTVDGTVDNPVLTSDRDGQRVMAFQVNTVPPPERLRVYLLAPGHAPRAFDANGLGSAASLPWDIHLRDYDRDGGFEIVTTGRGPEGSPVGTIAGIVGSPTVGQPRLTVRFDMLRAAYGDASVRDFDAHLRGFHPSPSDSHVACALLDRLADAHDAHALVAATGGTFTVIPYTLLSQPLHGSPHRISRRDLQRSSDPSEILGNLAGMHCSDLDCTWDQSLCRATGGDGERGYFWFADGGRRLAAVSRYTPQ